MKNPNGMTDDERRRLMAGEMPDIERRAMLKRIMSWWTPDRVADALIEKANAAGCANVAEYLARPLPFELN